MYIFLYHFMNFLIFRVCCLVLLRFLLQSYRVGIMTRLVKFSSLLSSCFSSCLSGCSVNRTADEGSRTQKQRLYKSLSLCGPLSFSLHSLSEQLVMKYLVFLLATCCLANFILASSNMPRNGLLESEYLPRVSR